LKEILRCGVLTDLTLEQCLGKIYRETCASDLESCREAIGKLQALLLAENLSELKDAKKTIGEYMYSMRISLSDDDDIKERKVTWGEQGL
jgi:hypothetical protein